MMNAAKVPSPMIFRPFVLGLLMLGAAASAAAQSDPSALPMPLVTALMAGSQYSPARTAQYFVATTPTGWPAGLIPSSASVVGGMKTSSQLIAVFADTTKRFLAGYLKQLGDSGWTQPSTDDGPGFQSSSGGGRSSYYCRDSSRVSAMAVPGATTGAFIYVAYQRGDVMGCMNPFRVRRPTSQLELPKMPPPSGMSSMNAGSGSNGDEVDAHIRLAGDLSTAVILTHYVSLLKVAGWTTDAVAATPGIAAQLVQARDSEGKGWTGWILVAAIGTSKDVSIAMRRASQP